MITDVFETDTASPSATAQPTETPLETDDAGVTIALPGLPVGGDGIATDAGGAWCVSLFWNDTLPEGVTLTVDTVVLHPDTPAAVGAAGCSGLPPCVGATIEAPGDGCSVLLTPGDASADVLRFRLDGTLHCPDEPTCDDAATLGDDDWSEVSAPPANSGGGDAGGDAEEPLAAEDGTLSIELAGLPYGFGVPRFVGEAWCELIGFGWTSLGAGTEIAVTRIRFDPPGAATVTPIHCYDGAPPPCPGAVLTDDAQFCSLAFVPADPDAATVHVRIDGTQRCPSSCTAIGTLQPDYWDEFSRPFEPGLTQ